MAAIVGIDAEVLYVPFADVDGDGALLLPIWDSSTETWDFTPGAADYTWVRIPERNEFSLNINVDVAEHKVFVTSLAEAWVEKARLYMDWSGSLSGYYDDSDDTVFTQMRTGLEIVIVFFDSKRSTSDYWVGKCLLTSVDHSTPNEDFSTLDVDFEGTGKLYRSALPTY